ncbi:DUF5134 domain-containing protein (plasmid) [Streptomyces sp. NBC_01005]|uniref:DUF5134 domain-containing protein n=1 Tax=unclassified Streptomyces TaxID=2593676 RepID=UPI002F919651|nr:DUF5134 domain-containing protein [Streptomyces sp. NBC_01005]WTD00738.1 DUF5134 domain-containing protein [Streptomyces sp. NBC_01650]
MIAATGLRWIMTLLFCALAVYGLWRAGAVRSHPWIAWLAHVLHAVMSLAMFAMSWSWGMDLPGMPQVIFFSAVAVWFVVTALVLPNGPESRVRALAGRLPHAVMTGAMAWMVAAMSSDVSMGASGAGQAHDMPGMDMSAPGALATMTLSSTGDRWSAGLLALVLLALALWWLAEGFDTGRAVPRAKGGAVSDGTAHAARDAGCHGLMALGMAVMLVVMV